MLTVCPMESADAAAAYGCMQDLPEEDGFSNGAYVMSCEAFMKDFLPQCERFARGIDLQPGDGHSQCIILFEDDAAMGVFKLRPVRGTSAAASVGAAGAGDWARRVWPCCRRSPRPSLTRTKPASP